MRTSGENARTPGETSGACRLITDPRLIFCLICLALLVRFGSDINITRQGHDFLSDDAYYYTVVARNFATTGEMTFDGHSSTNGFHPLWLWAQAAMFAAGGSHLSVTGQALAVVILERLILALALGAGMWWIWRNRMSRQIAAATLLALTLLVYPRHMNDFLFGMESVLVLPFTVLLLLFVWDSKWVWAGLAAALLVLSRLDTLVYVVAPLVLLASLRGRPSPGQFLKRCLLAGGPPVAVTLVLMALYQAIFGHPMPIHGVCKSSFPVPHFQFYLLTWPLSFALESGNPGLMASINLSTALLVLPVSAIALRHRGHASPGQRSFAMWLVVLAVIQLLAFALFQKWTKPVPHWYRAPLLVFSSGAISVAVINLIGIRKTLYACLGLALVFLALGGIREGRRLGIPRAPGPTESFVAAQGAETVWAATDCGMISFRTGSRFVNLDGLINGFDYQAALRDRRLAAYLEEAGVRYLLAMVWKHGPRTGRIEPMYAHRPAPDVFEGDYDSFDFYVYSYMYGAYSDTISLSRGQEVWRSKPNLDGIIPGRTVIFDLRATRTPGEAPLSE
jgi:hypothetical protein